MIEREFALYEITTHPIIVEREILNYRKPQGSPTRMNIKPLGIELHGDELKRYLAIYNKKKNQKYQNGYGSDNT